MRRTLHYRNRGQIYKIEENNSKNRQGKKCQRRKIAIYCPAFINFVIQQYASLIKPSARRHSGESHLPPDGVTQHQFGRVIELIDENLFFCLTVELPEGETHEQEEQATKHQSR